ncbi:MAG TPA: phosphate-starvation-inducible PsiE family protein [Terriglobales bacterium]|nr:phosphate-starvation-inducible PsiE family protein [Terriglobales bacterium]
MADAERGPRAVGGRRPERHPEEGRLTAWIALGFSRVEDVVYVGLALMLAVAALVLLGDGALALWRAIATGALGDDVVSLLDRILLILMIVEILYTVQVSLREHTLVPEPFLVIGLIAGIRRLLVLTAEVSEMLAGGGTLFRNAMIELGLLTVMVVALVASLAVLRRRNAPPPGAPKS